jgi:hypothetical protein
LTLWIREDVVQTWHATAPTGTRGHPRLYTDTAMATMAPLQEISHEFTEEFETKDLQKEGAARRLSLIWRPVHSSLLPDLPSP